jgi:transposase
MIEEQRTASHTNKAETRASQIKRAKAMKNAGYSNEAIARAFKISESSVRTLLKDSSS